MPGCNPNLGSNQSMSLSQIKYNPLPHSAAAALHLHLPQDISKEIHIFCGGKTTELACGQRPPQRHCLPDEMD